MHPRKPLYMLDTNIVSALMEDDGTARRRVCEWRMAELAHVDFAMSVIVDAELRKGLENRPSRKRAARYEQIVRIISVAYIGEGLGLAQRYATLHTALGRRGLSQQNMDVLIAAHALALDAVLVSNDEAFGRVHGLRLENWLAPQELARYPQASEPAAGYVRHPAMADLPGIHAPAFLMTRSLSPAYRVR